MEEGSAAVEITETATPAATEATSQETTATETTGEATQETASETTGEETSEQPSTPEVEEKGTELDRKGFEKALRDTKAWATKLAQEKKQLESELEEARQAPKVSGEDTVTQLAQAREMIGRVKEVYDDDLGGVLDSMFSLMERVIGSQQSFEDAVAKYNVTNYVTSKHPDAQEILGSEAFQEWAATAPKLVQKALLSDNAQELAEALDFYKASEAGKEAQEARRVAREKAKAKREATKAPSQTTSTPPNKKKFTKADVAKMSSAEYEANREEILALMSRGELK